MVIIQTATLSDAHNILNIAKTTFSETFLEYNSTENLNLYLENHLTLLAITRQLLNPNSIFYMAVKENEIVGYLKINFAEAQTELRDKTSLEIERIYVLKSCHGQKIGQSMMDKAVEVCKNLNLHYIWLGVWENNKKGINFYRKNGFQIFDSHVFMIGNDCQTDFLMKVNI